MKSHLMFGFFVVILLFVQAYPAMAQSGDHVVINEVDINPPGDDSKSVAEWVELYNPTNQTMDVGGWTIGAASGLKTTYKVPVGTQLKSGGFLAYTFGPLWFPDISAAVQLKDKNGTVIDQTPLLSDIENNLKSWQRTTDGLDTDSASDWIFKTSNAGSSNGKTSSTATQSSLTITVLTDKTNYIFGEPVKITGQVSKRVNVPNQSYTPEEINIVISDSSGFKRKIVMYPDRLLSFKSEFKTDRVFNIPEGGYKVSVEYAGATSEAEFSIGEKAFVAPQKDASALITISTDKLQYVPGERATISADTSKIIPFAGMQFKVFDPSNKQVYDGTLYPDTKGKFSVQIFISTVRPVFGIYNVVATYDKATTKTTYELVQDIKEDKAISLVTDKRAYGLGDTVIITGRLNTVISPTLELEIVQPFVSKNVANTFVIKDLLRTKDFGGDGTFRYEFKIPSNNERLGEYKVKVNAQSLDSTEVSFNVVENPDEFVDVISGPLSLTTDKPVYAVGDTLVISGRVSETKDLGRQNVKISITDDSGKPIISKGDPGGSAGKNQDAVYSFTGIPDSTGQFEVKSSIYRNVFQKGTYLIKAVYGENTVSTSFSVVDSVDLGSGVKIIASTDKEIYGIGDQVQLTGKVSTFTAQTSYQITITDPNGKQTRSSVTINNGQFSWGWTIPDYLQTFGIYKLTVSSDSDKTDVFFKISQNPESDTILQPLMIETDKAVYTSGDTITVFGHAITKSSSTTSGSIVNVRPIITIKTDANKVVYTSTPDLNTGGQFQSSFKVVPAVFKTGEYKVIAKYYKETAQTVFKVDDTFGSGGDVPLVLLLETDRDQYLPGDTVKITGKTSKIVSVFEVDVTVSKGGEAKSPIAIKFDPSGSFNYDYKIPQTNSLGIYTVKADTDFDTVVDKFEVVSELPQETTEEPTGETPISIIPTKITDKVNRITGSSIPVLIEAKEMEDLTYTPRLFDGLLRVNQGDESSVNIKLTFDGVCIIGPDSDCQVTKSTRDDSSLYQIIEIDGENLKVRYSGSGAKLEKFTILPDDSDGMIPSGDWNVEIIKNKQISRFYYKISYTSQ
ncbi:MAG TPA: lamin tail domain-containing protein [Nitrosopumilaceae archaeon]|nr:lamin tail domain-containing protein [Nitrosopumilaceae archaeon]